MRFFFSLTVMVFFLNPIIEAKESIESNTTQTLNNREIITTLKSEHAQLLQQLEQLTLKNKILKTKVKLKELSIINENYSNNINFEAELQKLQSDAKLAKIKAEKKTSEINIAKSEWELKTEKLEAEMKILKMKQERASYLDKEPLYLDNPLKEDNTLVISDRRIALNGVISSEMAKKITHKINYFNNKDPKKPIFIVIDSSPGGSVMAGYLIIKAMESSKAPIYVVLKSFAASMAAIIVSTVENSFAYSHATMLHHQPSIFLQGSSNLTEQKENYRQLEKWWRYLAKPVADKMGISLEEFQKQMYQHSSKGDWTEFAEDAYKLKWVNHIVTHIEETGVLNDIIENQESGEKSENKSSRASQKNFYLPRLAPTDAYLLYNPDGYYKVL